MVTLIERTHPSLDGDTYFEVLGSDGRRCGSIYRTDAFAYRCLASVPGIDQEEKTLAAAIEVLTGYCPAGGVAIK